MPDVRLYVDEDSQSRGLVAALRTAGFDTETTHDAHLLGAPDSEQLSHATNSTRVIITHNIRDFRVLHDEFARAGETHSGIVRIHRERRFSPGEVVRRLRRLIDTTEAMGLDGQIKYLSNYSA